MPHGVAHAGNVNVTRTIFSRSIMRTAIDAVTPLPPDCLRISRHAIACCRSAYFSRHAADAATHMIYARSDMACGGFDVAFIA